MWSKGPTMTSTVFPARCCAAEQSTPSWKVEQKYSTKVLVGNWLEERLTFKKFDYGAAKSCHTVDYIPFPDSRPDTLVRRNIIKRLQGLPRHLMLTDQGEEGCKNLVTQYDEHFLRHGNPTLPRLRTYDPQTQGWLPERSDYPIKAPPTNFGLYEVKYKEWTRKPPSIYRSAYSDAYKPPTRSAPTLPRLELCHRTTSSAKLPSDNFYKELDLKTQTYVQAPDRCAEFITETPLVDTAA